MSKNMYDFSIIIPHKNIPELLERCIASIPQRDDVQVVIVDDNSDPAIVDFDRFPGLGRLHTKVIFGKNEDGRRGAGYARNLGMDAAEGRWLVFADADDFFLPAIAEMMDKYRGDDSDMVLFYYELAYSETLEKIEIPGPNVIAECLRRNRLDRVRYSNLVPWSRFVKRELTEKHGLRFEEVMHANDTWFSSLAGYYARKIAADPAAIYCYIRREESLTGKMNKSWDSELMRFNVMVRTKRFFNTCNEPNRQINTILANSILKRYKLLGMIEPKQARMLKPVVRDAVRPRERIVIAMTNIAYPLYVRIKKIAAKLIRR